MTTPDIFKIKEWGTPATAYPLSTFGKAGITRSRYSRGIYNFHGAVPGYEFYQLTKPIFVTSLLINGKTWMVDDPNHWLYIKRMAMKMSGHVLVGGLGLGLIVHALALNPAVTKVTVVEMMNDVIELVGDLLPKDLPVNCVYDEIANYVQYTTETFDDVFIDIWVTEGREHTIAVLVAEVLPLADLVQKKLGKDMYALGFSGDEPILSRFGRPGIALNAGGSNS